MLKKPFDIHLSHRPLKGVLALFNDAETLKEAAAQIRDRKVSHFDAFTPFPVHGLEHSMGLKRSPIPWITFLAGLTGCSLGMLFQWWTSAVDWPLNVGGKPLASWPAFIPVTFECTILFAGLATAAAVFIFCGLPDFFKSPLDPSLTADRFGLFIYAEDPLFREQEFKDLLKKAGAYDVRTV